MAPVEDVCYLPAAKSKMTTCDTNPSLGAMEDNERDDDCVDNYDESRILSLFLYRCKADKRKSNSSNANNEQLRSDLVKMYLEDETITTTDLHRAQSGGEDEPETSRASTAASFRSDVTLVEPNEVHHTERDQKHTLVTEISESPDWKWVDDDRHTQDSLREQKGAEYIGKPVGLNKEHNEIVRGVETHSRTYQHSKVARDTNAPHAKNTTKRRSFGVQHEEACSPNPEPDQETDREVYRPGNEDVSDESRPCSDTPTDDRDITLCTVSQEDRRDEKAAAGSVLGKSPTGNTPAHTPSRTPAPHTVHAETQETEDSSASKSHTMVHQVEKATTAPPHTVHAETKETGHSPAAKFQTMVHLVESAVSRLHPGGVVVPPAVKADTEYTSVRPLAPSHQSPEPGLVMSWDGVPNSVRAECVTDGVPHLFKTRSAERDYMNKAGGHLTTWAHKDPPGSYSRSHTPTFTHTPYRVGGAGGGGGESPSARPNGLPQASLPHRPLVGPIGKAGPNLSVRITAAPGMIRGGLSGGGYRAHYNTLNDHRISRSASPFVRVPVDRPVSDIAVPASSEVSDIGPMDEAPVDISMVMGINRNNFLSNPLPANVGENGKRKRRKVEDLDKRYPCTRPDCNRRYASVQARYLHIRLKHNYDGTLDD